MRLHAKTTGVERTPPGPSARAARRQTAYDWPAGLLVMTTPFILPARHLMNVTPLSGHGNEVRRGNQPQRLEPSAHWASNRISHTFSNFFKVMSPTFRESKRPLWALGEGQAQRMPCWAGCDILALPSRVEREIGCFPWLNGPQVPWAERPS